MVCAIRVAVRLQPTELTASNIPHESGAAPPPLRTGPATAAAAGQADAGAVGGVAVGRAMPLAATARRGPCTAASSLVALMADTTITESVSAVQQASASACAGAPEIALSTSGIDALQPAIGMRPARAGRARSAASRPARYMRRQRSLTRAAGLDLRTRECSNEARDVHRALQPHTGERTHQFQAPNGHSGRLIRAGDCRINAR